MERCRKKRRREKYKREKIRRNKGQIKNRTQRRRDIKE
jgi:hypothetical protein